MRAKKLMEYLVFSFETNKEPVLIKGAPGVGKSDIVKQAAAKVRWEEFYRNFTGYKSPELLTKIASKTIGAKLIISHPVVADPTDYKGLPFVVNNEAEFLPFGELKQLIYAEEPTIFFLDDLGQATPAVQSAVMQLLLARRINGHKISDHVVFVGATNRREDRANVGGILEPVKGRFKGGIIELEPHLEDWCKWAWENNMPSQLISYLQFRPKQLFNFNPTRDIENSPNPRTNEGVGNAINNNVPTDLRFEVVKGIAGETYAIEFEAYLKVFMTLPSIHEIESNPHSALVPTEISAKFAAMGLISDAMNQKNVGAFITYLQRLGDEMLIAAMKNAAMKNPAICATQDFINFGVKYSEILMS